MIASPPLDEAPDSRVRALTVGPINGGASEPHTSRKESSALGATTQPHHPISGSRTEATSPLLIPSGTFPGSQGRAEGGLPSASANRPTPDALKDDRKHEAVSRLA